MGDFFKPRKIPRHLIIEESYVYSRKPRGGLLKLMLWFIGLLLATGLALQLRHLHWL